MHSLALATSSIDPKLSRVSPSRLSPFLKLSLRASIIAWSGGRVQGMSAAPAHPSGCLGKVNGRTVNSPLARHTKGFSHWTKWPLKCRQGAPYTTS
ncbi:hypothetical protein AALO_G00086550, partial [Alosa alosa]